jgi:hypothetical protein
MIWTSTIHFNTNCYGYNSIVLLLYSYAGLCNTIVDSALVKEKNESNIENP